MVRSLPYDKYGIPIYFPLIHPRHQMHVVFSPWPTLASLCLIFNIFILSWLIMTIFPVELDTHWRLIPFTPILGHIQGESKFIFPFTSSMSRIYTTSPSFWAEHHNLFWYTHERTSNCVLKFRGLVRRLILQIFDIFLLMYILLSRRSAIQIC